MPFFETMCPRNRLLHRKKTFGNFQQKSLQDPLQVTDVSFPSPTEHDYRQFTTRNPSDSWATTASPTCTGRVIVFITPTTIHQPVPTEFYVLRDAVNTISGTSDLGIKILASKFSGIPAFPPTEPSIHTPPISPASYLRQLLPSVLPTDPSIQPSSSAVSRHHAPHRAIYFVSYRIQLYGLTLCSSRQWCCFPSHLAYIRSNARSCHLLRLHRLSILLPRV
jgi:hypothetical protein